MNYERERIIAESKAKKSLAEGNWKLAAYNLFNASRATTRLGAMTDGRTSRSFRQMARHYEEMGDRALVKAKGVKNEQAQSHVTTVVVDDDDRDESDWVIAERPDVRLADVAGMNEMKEIIQTHIVLPMEHPEVYAQYAIRPGSGVLMYGPPGTGKTHVARAIAGEVDAAFIPVEMKKVLSKWFGETERLLGELFEVARQHPRTVIFFDEAEALFPKRGQSDSSVMARVVPQLLQLINGLDPAKNCVILLGATNRPWLMDEAALRPGRFGHLVYVGPPDVPARRKMIENAMQGSPTENLDFEALAQMTQGYSGADIASERDSVCVSAKLSALKRTLATLDEANGSQAGPEPVTMDDFNTALGRIAPSITDETVKKFEEFAQHAAMK